MKALAIQFVLIFIYQISNAQDIIVKTDSTRTECDIYREDDMNYYVYLKKKKTTFDTYVPKSRVAYIIRRNGQMIFDDTFDLIVKVDSSKIIGHIYKTDSLFYYMNIRKQNNYFS